MLCINGHTCIFVGRQSSTTASERGGRVVEEPALLLDEHKLDEQPPVPVTVHEDVPVHADDKSEYHVPCVHVHPRIMKV